jgi:hypothetical protein
VAVVISEIVTEVVLDRPGPAGPAPGDTWTDEDLDLVVRRAAERVLETLRREWDR